MEGYSLTHVVTATGGMVTGCDDPDAVFPTGAAIDSRALKPGELFVALTGERTDGHRFVSQALEQGASGALVSAGWFENLPEDDRPDGPLIVVETPERALGDLARRYRKRFDIPLIAITGSNGKTTTKEMTAAVLRTRYNVLATPGNLNTRLGVPMTLLQLASDHEVAVIEMGITEHGGLRYLCDIAAPTIGVITNIGPAHIEFFGSVEGVAKAKGELLDYLDESSLAILNLDDLYLSKERARSKGRLLGFGIEEISQFRGERLILDQEGCGQFLLQSLLFTLRVPGRHNVYNALAAAAAGSALDVPLEDAARALAAFRPPALRSQVLKHGGVTLLNDSYNANPGSVRASLEALAALPAEGRRIAVLGDMLELGDIAEQAHNRVGRIASDQGVNAVFVLGDFARHVAAGAVEAGMDAEQARTFESLEDLVASLRRFVTAGDVVLVKGSRGMQMERVPAQLGFDLEQGA